MSVTGWGRTRPARVCSVPARGVPDVARALAAAGGDARARGVLARGLGRAYGDAAANSGGTVIDCRGLTGSVSWYGDGRLAAPAGMSIGALLEQALPSGWTLPVLPGTRHVTLGGAIAADVHGKNHVRDGTIGRWVDEIVIVVPTGETRTLSPTVTPAEFAATVGGMGLTGVIVAATLRLIPVPGSGVSVDTARAADLDSLLAALLQDRNRYSVAWVDCLAAGRDLGRGVLTSGEFVERPRRGRGDGLPDGSRPAVAVPPLPVGAVSPALVRAFNAAWFARAPQRRADELQSVSRFFYPLDGIAHWNRLYGPRGFVQYQYVVPLDRDDVLRTTLERLAAAGAAPFLAVLKQFGPAGAAPLSFPIPGWTFAVDIPVGPPDLPQVLDRLDEEVAGAGGRVYLAKDARLRADALTAMYPRLPEWSAGRKRLDPTGLMRSDLGRRLRLVSD